MSSAADKNEVDDFKEWKNKKIKSYKQKREGGTRKNNHSRKWVYEAEEIDELQQKYAEFDNSKVKTFSDLPLSKKTLSALEEAGFTEPTAIQKASVFPALQGRDILGAAKTGSGKTLAFLIPVLERLFRERWSAVAGPGALIISPTRELAYQIFEVLKKVGKQHDFSAGLVIGGKDVKSEAVHMSRTNIVVCTPGRLLQHMDETTYFEMNDLQILVLDEADRILDMGFKTTINAVVENLPKNRQTLLFSATQTKSVKDLARLSLKDPAYVSVHESSKHATPQGLSQKYIVCKLENKLNLAYSFIKNHLKTKTLIFLSSCKQVQYIYTAFCKMQPGVPLMMLHGNMKQHKRMDVYDTFCRKKFVTLFCTDVVARGLDFPGVDWVVQLDCPEDADTYIHRAGRTARYHGNGHALLALLPQEEEEMMQQLNDKKIPITKTEISTKRFIDVKPDLESLCAENVDVKAMAQRCFVAYVRAVFFMKNKSVFCVESLTLPEYARSLGLVNTPNVKFFNKRTKRTINETSKMNMTQQNEENPNEEKEDDSLNFHLNDDDSNLFTVKKNNFTDDRPVDEQEDEALSAPQSKRKKRLLATNVAIAKKMVKKGYKMNQKIVFNEEGKVEEAWPPLPQDHPIKKVTEEEPEPEEKTNKESENDSSDYDGCLDIDFLKERMKTEDVRDKEKHRQRVKEKHRTERRKEREKRKRIQARKEGRRYEPSEKREEEVTAVLASPAEESDNEVSSGSEEDVPNDLHHPESLEEYFNNEDLSLQEQEKLAMHFLNT